MATFHLSKAGPEDIAACVDVLFDTFKHEYFHQTIGGPDTPHWRANLTQTYIETLQTMPGDYWMKVIDTATGKVIGTSNWDIQPNVVPSVQRNMKTPWLDDDPEMQAVVAARLAETAEVKKKYLTGPHIRKYIDEGSRYSLLNARSELRMFAVHPEYARRGGKMKTHPPEWPARANKTVVGTMMMRWGCELSDLLFLPLWIRSTAAGTKLYTSFGCAPVPGEVKKEGGTLLKREVRTDTISGGKPMDAVAKEPADHVAGS